MSQTTHPSVLFLSGVRGDTRRYRTFHPYEQLKLAGLPVFLSHTTDPALPARITQARVVIFHRVTWDAYIEKLIDDIESRGGLALLDTDDLTFEPAAFSWIDSPDFQDPIRARLYQEDLGRNRKTLERCQAVLTSTEYLGEQIRALGKPAWVHRNAFSLEMLALSQQARARRTQHPGRLVIGYASGTPTHNRDFEQVRPALAKLMDCHPQTELWLVGPLDPGSGWERFGNRVKHIQKVPWRQLPALLAQLDINLAPLTAGNPFAKSKSEIKFVEAGLVSVPTIATPTAAFLAAIHPGENGMLAATTEEWSEHLERLLTDADLRQRLGESAHRSVMEQYHPCARAGQLVALLNEVHLQLHQAPLWDLPPDWKAVNPTLVATSGWVPAGVENHPTYIEMGVYTMRNRGMRTLLCQIWVYIRRAVAPLFPYRVRSGKP
ncbi:MAG: glycosyltransferase family 4 protein [Anaerolineaceae bacterium]|nr:glycosyltransferase family 4 protein [Anaerolineaceae bacterium]